MAYQSQFKQTLHSFIKDLDRYNPTIGTKCMLERFDQLNMALVRNRLSPVLKSNEKSLKNKDNSLFNNSFIILPNIDLKDIWIGLSSGQKKKVWTYLNLLLALVDLFIDSVDNSVDNSVDEEKGKEEDIEFNPFVGVGKDGELGVNDIIGEDDDGPPEVGIGSMTKMLGLDKILDVENLQSELKNMNEEEIDKATQSIKSMIGPQMGGNAGNLIDNMLKNVTDELKNNDLSKGDPMKNIMKIAESVAAKMKPEIDDGDVDVDEMFKQKEGDEPNAFNMIGQMMNEAGNGGAFNPMMMIQQMMSSGMFNMPKHDGVD